MSKFGRTVDQGKGDRPGVFCLEGEWSEDLQNRRSVKPVLQLLEEIGLAQTIHRDVSTTGDFFYFLDRWVADYEKFKVLYLVMHGDQDGIALSTDEVAGSATLDEIADFLKGACKGRVIYFGSCLTMKNDPGVLKDFAKKTGARAVIGYSQEVDWMHTAAFEVFLLEQLLTKVKSPGIFNALVKDHPVLAKRFGLVIATSANVYK